MLSPTVHARPAALYGVFGGQVNVTDGTYVYMRGPSTNDNTPLYEYTLMPTRMRGLFSPKELKNWVRDDGFNFTKNVKLMKIKARTARVFTSEKHPMGRGRMATLLFNIQEDPGQTTPLNDIDIETKMITLMLQEMIQHDCPMEQYERLGLPSPKEKIKEGKVMPSTNDIRNSCVCGTTRFDKYSIWKGNGYPKLAFGPVVWEGEPTGVVQFPDNLRLRPGYKFSQTKTKPKKRSKM